VHSRHRINSDVCVAGAVVAVATLDAVGDGGDWEAAVGRVDVWFGVVGVVGAVGAVGSW
jgi:hypothetical protein